MREYALTCAMAASQAADPMPVRLVRNFWTRRKLRLARAADNAEADINWALSLPLSVDPLTALEERLFRRARGLLR